MPRAVTTQASILAERRAELQRRRELAQLRRRRQVESKFYRRLAPKLCSAGVSQFSRVPAIECARLMNNFSHLPAQDERLIWWDISGSRCASWEEFEDRDEILLAALKDCTVPDERLVVIQHTSEAGLSILGASLVATVSEVLFAAQETVWIISKAGRPWIIEVSFTDKEVCYARFILQSGPSVVAVPS